MQIASSTTAASRRGLLGRGAGRTLRLGLYGLGLALPFSLLRWRVPVVDHLQRKDGVERKARDESIQDQLVINLLQRGEDARKGTGKVVEDLGMLVTSN